MKRSLLFYYALLLVPMLSSTGRASPTSPLTDTSSTVAPAPIRNVVVIIGDDHAASVIGAYGNNLIRTPNLDQLASEGTTFLRAYANSPVCTPSRQSILTGRYPHAAGVTMLHTPLPEEQVTIAEHMKQQGYRTGIVGKGHFNIPASAYELEINPSHGFDTIIDRYEYYQYTDTVAAREVPDVIRSRQLPWMPFQTPARQWLNADALPDTTYDVDSEGTYFANRAVDFIRDNQDTSFLLWVAFYEPHSPFNFPIEYTGRYKPADIKLPKVSEEDTLWTPDIFRNLSDDDKRGVIAAYYNSVEYLDKNVGVVLDALNEANLDENTLVMYLGDHGYLLGQHNRFEKHMMWEPAVRAPLIVRPGDRFPAGQRTNALTEFVDIVPTITELTGVPPLPTAQGRSFAGLLENPEDTIRDYVFSEFLVDNKAMLRGRKWKYIFTSGQYDLGQGYATGFGAPGLTHRLYDEFNDPGETTNLANRPEHQAVLQRFQLQMLDLFKETHPNVDQLPGDLTIDEQLSWFCEPVERIPDLSGWIYREPPEEESMK